MPGSVPRCALSDCISVNVRFLHSRANQAQIVNILFKQHLCTTEVAYHKLLHQNTVGDIMFLLSRSHHHHNDDRHNHHHQHHHYMRVYASNT